MIELTQQLCEELDLTYWQLNLIDAENQPQVHTISRDEKELLRKILLAKGVKLNEGILEIRESGIVVINLDNNQLIFDDVNLIDQKPIVHLAKISDMLTNPEQKKHTWYKLKHLDL